MGDTCSSAYRKQPFGASGKRSADSWRCRPGPPRGPISHERTSGWCRRYSYVTVLPRHVDPDGPALSGNTTAPWCSLCVLAVDRPGLGWLAGPYVGAFGAPAFDVGCTTIAISAVANHLEELFMEVPVRERVSAVPHLTRVEAVTLLAWGLLWFLPTMAFEPFQSLFFVPPVVFLGLLAADIRARRARNPRRGTDSRLSMSVTVAVGAVVALYIVVSALVAWTELIYVWVGI